MNTPSPPLSKLQAQFNRAHISGKDFQEAQEYALAFLQTTSEVVQRALLTAAVVSYARPFTQNEKQPEDRATPTVPIGVLRELTPAESNLHAHVIDLRNRAIAHSTVDLRPLERVGLHEHGFSVQSTYFDLLNQQVDLSALAEMCRKLSLACHLIKYELNAQIFRQENAA